MVTPRTLRPFLGALNTSMSVSSPWVRYGRWLATQYRLLLSRQVNRLFLFLPRAGRATRPLPTIQTYTIIKNHQNMRNPPTISHFITLPFRETRETTTHHWRLVVFLRICIFEDLFFLTLARLNGDQLVVDVNGLWLVDAYCLDLFGLSHFGTHMYIMYHYVTYPFSESQFAQSGTIAPTSQFGRKEQGNNAFVEKSSWSHVKKRFPSVAIKVFWRTTTPPEKSTCAAHVGPANINCKQNKLFG